MDLNGDGIKDILSGSYSRDVKTVPDMAGLFQVLWGTKDGFKAAEPLRGSDGEPLIIGSKDTWTEDNIVQRICTRPFAVDWDNDGKLDLVVGNFAGEFWLFKGEGANAFNPKATQIMSTDGKPLAVPHHGDPMVIDWDNDGDLDILSGSANGGVYLAENTGTRTAPAFKPFVELIKAPDRGATITGEADIKVPAADSRIWVADVNGDGKLDILLGDCVSYSVPAAGLTREQMEERQKEWLAKYKELTQEKAGDQTKLHEEISKHYRKRSEFARDIHTGFVWLYLQK